MHKDDKRRPIKEHCSLATGKVLNLSFFDSHGMVYHEYCCHTVNAQVFRNVLECFLDAFHAHRPRGTVRGHIFMHMDNALAHTAGRTKAFL